jgi:predicted ATP-binding protein involved in virulence
MATTQTTNRVKSLKVTALFGLYDHLVALKDDRVTVIHGPNGVGKTVLLKLTNSFLRGRYTEIARVPFKTFEILFDDSGVARIDMEGTYPDSMRMTISYEGAGHALESVMLDGEALNVNRMARQIADVWPYFSQVGPYSWLDRRNDEVLTADELVARAQELPQQEQKKRSSDEPKGLHEFRSRMNVHLIEAQRLIRFAASPREWRFREGPGSPITATVQEYSRDLKGELESTLANYAKQSQKLDQTFPQRLLQGSPEPLAIDQLSTEMEAIEASRARLERIGLLEGDDFAQESYPLQASQLQTLQAEQMRVMSVYARDTNEKLSVLEPLADRIELLLSVLNKKFTNKTVNVSRESGLVVLGTDRKPIPVTALSSGEQHELVLLYDLLFKVKPNTLVLIDEPELSLHISWQKGFMDDLLEIIRIAHFDVLIATHSPYIVGERSDLLVVLSPDVAS